MQLTVAAMIEQLHLRGERQMQYIERGYEKSSCSKQFQNSTQTSSPSTRVFFMRYPGNEVAVSGHHELKWAKARVTMQN